MANKRESQGRKGFNKAARLNAAKNWIQTYTGKNIIKGYAKWYGVDKLCAISELKILGIIISESLEHQIKSSIQAQIEQKKKRKESKIELNLSAGPIYGIDYDEYCSFIIGFTSGGASYGISHDEVMCNEMEYEDNIDDEIFF